MNNADQYNSAENLSFSASNELNCKSRKLCFHSRFRFVRNKVSDKRHLDSN